MSNTELKDYEETRNHPETRGTSRLSPYLHFGNIGPLTIARAVKKAVAEGKASSAAGDRYLEQLIGWRELAVLFVRHEPNYDNWECAAPWARKTLVEHAGDPRPHRYTLKQLERGETGDELVECGAAGDGHDRLDAQLHAHVLGEEDSGMGSGPGDGLRMGGDC